MKFIKQFLLFSFILFALCWGLIISIDPYEKYGINVFGFKTKAVMFGREVKYHMLDNTKHKYEVFILGSSAAHRYRVKDMEELSGMKSFNYSVQHATPEDYLAIMRHILKKQKPKVILLQIDFYSLNKHYAVDPRLYNSPLKEFLTENKNNYFDPKIVANTYLTLNALWDSFRVIGVNAFGEARHAYLEHGDYPREKPVSAVTGVELSQAGYGKYEFDTKRVEILKNIRQLAEQNNIRLVAITAPVSYEHYLGIEKQGLSKELDEFKVVLRRHFPEVYDFVNAGIIPYSTTEYFRNSSHPSPELSRLVLQKVFKKGAEIKQDEFGRMISSQ